MSRLQILIGSLQLNTAQNSLNYEL